MTIRERQHKILYRKRFRLSPAHIIVSGFLIIILLGAFLLCLPISARSREWTNFLNALFTSTSAVCVTGLSVITISSSLSIFGQVVLLLLIQIGGLGFMSLTTMFMLLLRKKITLKNRLVIKEALNQNENRGLVRLTRNILFVTLAIEGFGFLLLLYPLVSANGAIGVWQAAFTAISAFCNAVFDIIGESSLTGFAGNIAVNLSVMFLIVLGGIGFTVIMDIGKHKGNFKRLAVHSKIVLVATFILILSGGIFYFGVEYSNVGTLGNMSFGKKVLAAFFQSVTTRTAGFATINQNAMTPAGKFGTMLLMFIGASPGSTGGGIKTTSTVILLLVTMSGIRKNGDITVNKRKIGTYSARKAVSILVAGTLVVIISTFILLITERGKAADTAELLTFENTLFECFSAFGTVGLSCGLTPLLSAGGKIVLMLVMFFGRVGIITIGLMFMQGNSADNKIKYPDANIMIG